MEIVQLIGSYAGFAAVIGLAVLSALYFSQARDVRRLREWAGRAPERTGAPSVQGTASPPSPAAARQPVAQPGAAAQPQTAVTAPANATSGSATPAAGASAVPARAGATTAPGVPGNAAGPPAPPTRDPATPAPASTAAPAPPAPPAPPPVAPGGPRPAPTGGAPRPPARVALGPSPQRRPVAAASSPVASTSLSGAGTPWYRRMAPRYIVLIVAGVLIVGGGVAYGVTQLGAGQPSSPGAQAPAAGDPPPGDGAGRPAKPAAVKPGEITVAVLNGTTVPGLARSVADDLRAAGYRRGRTDNATEQARAESVVFYSDGSEGAARAVGEELGIDQRQPMDAGSQALAGNADVVVVLGADRSG